MNMPEVRECMERIPLLLLVLIVSTVAVDISAFPQDPGGQPLSSLDRRFEQCIRGTTCTTREGLRILGEMTDNMRGNLRRIDQACAKTDYRNCFNPDADDVVQWHKMHDQMRDLAAMLERRYTAAAPAHGGKQLNLIEPSAGPAPKPNPYTNPDEEQLQEHKEDWWQEWTPPEEANPYHKW